MNCFSRIFTSLVVVITILAPPLSAQSTRPICQHPDNPNYFLWRGKAVALITGAEHYGAVINQDFDYIKYLNTLQRDGMNYTRIFAGAYVEPEGAFSIKRNTLAPKTERFLAPFKRSDQPGYANGGNKFDLEKFNPDYFDRLKSFISEAGKRGIVVEVTFFSSIYADKNWAIHPFNPDNNIQQYDVPDRKALQTTDCPQAWPYQEQYVRRIVSELLEFDNIFYEIQNEPWSDNHTMSEVLHPYWIECQHYPNAVEITLPRAVEWQAKIAKIIRDEEAGKQYPHLIAQNIANFRLAVREDEYAPEVDLLNFHYAFPQTVTWNRGHGKIIGYDETGFAGQEDATYRREAWRFMMSGGGLFNHLDYSFSVGMEDGTDSNNQEQSGGSPALRKQFGILSRFLHSFNLGRLVTDNSLVSHCPGASWMVLNEPGKAIAVYLEGRGGTDLTILLEKGVWEGRWIDPVTGGNLGNSTTTHHGGNVIISVPMFKGAAVLRLVCR